MERDLLSEIHNNAIQVGIERCGYKVRQIYRNKATAAS